MAESQLTIDHSEQMNEFAEALALAQGQMSNPVFDSVNPHFRNKYASLAAVRDAVIPPLAAQHIAVIQIPVTVIEQGLGGCVTMLLHKSGQYVTHTLLLPVNKADIQGYGSTFTYARRYSLMAIAGVAGEEDDDGENAIAGSLSHHSARTANGTFPVAETPRVQTNTSQSLWRETLRTQSSIICASWPHLSEKSTQTLEGLKSALRQAEHDDFYPESQGLKLADAVLQWVDKLDGEQEEVPHV